MYNYKEELKKRKPYFEDLKNLKGTIVYHKCQNGRLIVFQLIDSSYIDDCYLINDHGIQYKPQELKIANQEIIKEYVKQREEIYLNIIKQLKEKYKEYLK